MPPFLASYQKWGFDVFFTSAKLPALARCSILTPPGVLDHKHMQRLTARLLLLLALAGTFVPAVMQALAPPQHACCLRKSAHRCHTAGANDPVVGSSDCCPQQSRRAVTTSQWAHAQAASISTGSASITRLERVRGTLAPTKALPTSDTTRAPPDTQIA